jgi:hypothetical protein
MRSLACRIRPIDRPSKMTTKSLSSLSPPITVRLSFSSMTAYRRPGPRRRLGGSAGAIGASEASTATRSPRSSSRR